MPKLKCSCCGESVTTLGVMCTVCGERRAVVLGVPPNPVNWCVECADHFVESFAAWKKLQAIVEQDPHALDAYLKRADEPEGN